LSCAQTALLSTGRASAAAIIRLVSQFCIFASVLIGLRGTP
jgi:hypothetical protein